MATVKETKGNVKVGDGTPGPGRKKGVPNKITSEVKQMILDALDGAGGVEYLIVQAHAKPAAFLTLVGKVMPLQVTGADGGPVAFERIVREIVDPAKP